MERFREDIKLFFVIMRYARYVTPTMSYSVILSIKLSDLRYIKK